MKIYKALKRRVNKKIVIPVCLLILVLAGSALVLEPIKPVNLNKDSKDDRIGTSVIPQDKDISKTESQSEVKQEPHVTVNPTITASDPSSNPNKITDSPRGYFVPVGWNRDLTQELPRLSASLGTPSLNIIQGIHGPGKVDLLSNYVLTSINLSGYDTTNISATVTNNGGSTMMGNSILNFINVSYIGPQENSKGSTTISVNITNGNGDSLTLPLTVNWDLPAKQQEITIQPQTYR